MTILQLMKIAAAAPPGGSAQVAAPAPPPNAVGGPTITPAGGGAPMGGRMFRRAAQPVAASSPTGMSNAHSASPLQAPTTSGIGGQPVAHNGMMLPQEEAEAMKMQEAEAQAEAQKHQPKPAQPQQKDDTPYHNQLVQRMDDQLNDINARLKLPTIKAGSSNEFMNLNHFPGGGSSYFNPNVEGGMVGGTNAQPGISWLPENSALQGPLKFVRNIATAGIRNFKTKSMVDRMEENPQTPYGFAYARAHADPARVGVSLNPIWQLGANFASSLMDRPELEAGQLEGYANQFDQARQSLS